MLTPYCPQMFQGSPFYCFPFLYKIVFTHSPRDKFSVFLHLRMSWFPFQSWKIFSFATGFRINNYFLSVPKKTLHPFHSNLYSFWWEIYYHSNSFSPIRNVVGCFFFPGCFQDFFFILIFKRFIIMCLGMDFSGFIIFGMHSAFWICRFTSLAKVGKFSAINSSNTFSALSSFTSSPGLQWHKC